MIDVENERVYVNELHQKNGDGYYAGILRAACMRYLDYISSAQIEIDSLCDTLAQQTKRFDDLCAQSTNEMTEVLEELAQTRRGSETCPMCGGYKYPSKDPKRIRYTDGITEGVAKWCPYCGRKMWEEHDK